MGRRKRVEMRPTLLRIRDYTIVTKRTDDGGNEHRRGFEVQATDIAGACQEFEQRVKDGRIKLEPGEEQTEVQTSFF